MLFHVLAFSILILGVRSEDLDESEIASINKKDVIFAINCGGPAHVDIDGIQYEADNLKQGIASDYGTRWMIKGVAQSDMILYQTERYGLNMDLTYEFRLPAPGDYVLVMKFAEVYFQSPNQKVFDVFLNGYTILSEFDIFAVSGGRAVAYDVMIPLQIGSDHLVINENLVDLNNGVFKLTIAKGPKDNPKINAFFLKRGTYENLRGIPHRHRVLNKEFNHETFVDIDEPSHDEPILEHEQLRDDHDDDAHAKFASGPPVKNPYEDQDLSNYYVPIIATVVLVVPVIVCLLKM